MAIIKLKGGPLDGQVIDTDNICNGNNDFCPAHGHGYYHNENQSIHFATHNYDLKTGEYLGEGKNAR